MTTAIIVGIVLVLGCIVYAIAFNNGFKMGNDSGWIHGWNDCNNTHIEMSHITFGQREDVDERKDGWTNDTP